MLPFLMRLHHPDTPPPQPWRHQTSSFNPTPIPLRAIAEVRSDSFHAFEDMPPRPFSGMVEKSAINCQFCNTVKKQYTHFDRPQFYILIASRYASGSSSHQTFYPIFSISKLQIIAVQNGWWHSRHFYQWNSTNINSFLQINNKPVSYLLFREEEILVTQHDWVEHDYLIVKIFRPLIGSIVLHFVRDFESYLHLALALAANDSKLHAARAELILLKF